MALFSMLFICSAFCKYLYSSPRPHVYRPYHIQNTSFLYFSYIFLFKSLMAKPSYFLYTNPTRKPIPNLSKVGANQSQLARRPQTPTVHYPPFPPICSHKLYKSSFHLGTHQTWMNKYKFYILLNVYKLL